MRTDRVRDRRRASSGVFRRPGSAKTAKFALVTLIGRVQGQVGWPLDGFTRAMAEATVGRGSSCGTFRVVYTVAS